MEKRYSDLIRERRSVRTFDGQGISDETREQLKTFAESCAHRVHHREKLQAENRHGVFCIVRGWRRDSFGYGDRKHDHQKSDN